MCGFYEKTEALRALLADLGHQDLARELLDAERSGSTGGEIVGQIGSALRRFLERSLAPGIEAEIRTLLKESDRLWNGG